MDPSDGVQRRGFLGAVSAATALSASDLAVAGVAEVPLEQLTLRHFQPLIGDSFRLIANQERFDVQLIEAVSRGTGADRDSRFRLPFSLLFRGRMPLLTQGNYVLKHSVLGMCRVFMVPIYEADGEVTFDVSFA